MQRCGRSSPAPPGEPCDRSAQHSTGSAQAPSGFPRHRREQGCCQGPVDRARQLGVPLGESNPCSGGNSLQVDPVSHSADPAPAITDERRGQRSPPLSPSSSQLPEDGCRPGAPGDLAEPAPRGLSSPGTSRSRRARQAAGRGSGSRARHAELIRSIFTEEAATPSGAADRACREGRRRGG